MFPDADYPIHMKTLQLISSELQKNGYSAVLIPWQVDEKDNHSVPNIFQYRVDGVIAASATFNKSLYEECEEFDIPQAEWLSYQLTTFRQDFLRLARECVKTIVAQINSKNSQLVKMMVPVKLVKRNTTKF